MAFLSSAQSQAVMASLDVFQGLFFVLTLKNTPRQGGTFGDDPPVLCGFQGDMKNHDRTLSSAMMPDIPGLGKWGVVTRWFRMEGPSLRRLYRRGHPLRRVPVQKSIQLSVHSFQLKATARPSLLTTDT